MKVDLGSIDVDDDVRRALRKHKGEPGLATREEVREWADQTLKCASETVQEEAFRRPQPAEQLADV